MTGVQTCALPISRWRRDDWPGLTLLDVGSTSSEIFCSSVDDLPWRYVCIVETVHRAINYHASFETFYNDLEVSEPSLLA